MKALVLLLSLLVAAPLVHAVENRDHAQESASVKCECPPDCHCHQPGGTCPGGTCSPDCDCDKPLLGVESGIYIHPSMKEAIRHTEESLQLRTGDDDELKTGNPDFIWVGGQKQFTGFHPSTDFYKGAFFKRFKASESLAKDIPKTYDYRTFSHSPVRGQIQGSCWAEGGGSVFELNTNAVLGTKLVFAVNDIIDCSGLGTARGGGQASLEYPKKKGLALEEDYPYTGRDGRCKTDVERHYPLKEVAFLRGESGNLPTMQELQQAILEYGSMEVCGSASSLGGGGRQDTIRNGGTNHCYALAGWLDGKSLGWLDTPYLIIKNSWGDGTSGPLNPEDRSWGDKGYGYYPLAKGDGVHLKGSVITEIQYGFAGPILPKVPVVFTLDLEGVVLSITIEPAALRNWNQNNLTEAILAAVKLAEEK